MVSLTSRLLTVTNGITEESLDTYIPEMIESALFDGDARCYAVLDAARIKFLANRLETEDLEAACLYDGEESLKDVAPWLVALTPTAKLTMFLFLADETGKHPFALFDLNAAVFFRSHRTLDEMRTWLRRYTALPDEVGTRRFLRLAEPGYLAEVITTATSGADFFTNIDAHFFLLPTLTDGERALWAIEADGEPHAPARTPVIDAPVRAAFYRLRNDLAARRLARKDDDDMAARQARHDTYFKAMQAGFDAPETLQRAHNVLSQTPIEDHATFWASVFDGAWSLGYLCQMMAQKHNINEGLVR